MQQGSLILDDCHLDSLCSQVSSRQRAHQRSKVPVSSRELTDPAAPERLVEVIGDLGDHFSKLQAIEQILGDCFHSHGGTEDVSGDCASGVGVAGMVDRQEQAIGKVLGGQRRGQRDGERFLAHPAPSQRLQCLGRRAAAASESDCCINRVRQFLVIVVALRSGCRGDRSSEI